MQELLLPDLSATEALAARLAACARPGDAILLQGPLGAGKSAFSRAFLRAASDNPSLEVPSPSYTLVQSYDTKHGPIHHFDLWRLDAPHSVIELGWDELALDITLVEWPDRLGYLRPEHALEITFTPLDEHRRQVKLAGWEDRRF